VLFIGPEHCESADTIRDAGCGITTNPGDADSLVTAILKLESNPSLARRMGERGRTAFLNTHERRLCCNNWSELIARLLATTEKSRPKPAPYSMHVSASRGAAVPYLTASR
jgi:glycosyltransferase involved in cell wall biosynthesis